MSPRLFGRLGEDVGFLSRLSRPRHARPARPRRPRARRGRPRLLHPPSRAAQPSSSPAAPDAARPPCGKTCVFWYCSHVDAPLRPKRALLPGESPGRQNRQGRCAVETGPIRARTRIAGQKSRAREHGEGNVRRAEAVNPWPETAGTRT